MSFKTHELVVVAVMVMAVLVTGGVIGSSIASADSVEEKETAVPNFETKISGESTVEITLSEFNTSVELESDESTKVISRSDLDSYEDSVTVTIENLEKGETVVIKPIKNSVASEEKLQYHHHPEIYG